jgi:hypothetical protein
MWRKWLHHRRDEERMLAESTRALAQLRFALAYGALAPASGAHGAVPWVMRLREGAIDFQLAHPCTRAPHDPAHRELVIACGAALAQLRLSMRQLGFRESTVLFPDPWQPQLIATVHIDDSGPATPEAYVLYQALRAPLLVDDGRMMHAIDPSLLVEIKAVCEEERVSLHFVDRSLFGVGGRDHGERAQAEAPTSTALVRRAEEDESCACDPPSIEETLALLHPFQRSTFRPETQRWTPDHELALSAAVAAMVTTARDDAADWVAAGQALSRALLRARVDGVHAAVHSLGSTRLREELASDVHDALPVPQVALRFGYPRVTKLVRHETRMFEAVRLPPGGS